MILLISTIISSTHSTFIAHHSHTLIWTVVDKTSGLNINSVVGLCIITLGMPLSQSDLRTWTVINWNIYHLQVTTKVIYQNNKCQAIRPSEQTNVMRKRNVTIPSFTPHKGSFQDPFQCTYCPSCVSHKDTSAPTLTFTAVRRSLFKPQPPLKKTSLLLVDPNSTACFTHRHFPRVLPAPARCSPLHQLN